MTGTTTGGLVFPVSSEPVRDGATRMQYFLEQLDQDPVEVVAEAIGSQNVPDATWTKAAWAGSEYNTGNGLAMNPSGAQPTLAGRYWVEFAFTFPSGMNNCRRGIGIGLASATKPENRNIIMTHNFGDATKDEQQMRITTTLTVPAGSAGIVTGWMWAQAGVTVVVDRTKFSMTVRRLRLGQSHG